MYIIYYFWDICLLLYFSYISYIVIIYLISSYYQILYFCNFWSEIWFLCIFDYIDFCVFLLFLSFLMFLIIFCVFHFCSFCVFSFSTFYLFYYLIILKHHFWLKYNKWLIYLKIINITIFDVIFDIWILINYMIRYIILQTKHHFYDFVSLYKMFVFVMLLSLLTTCIFHKIDEFLSFLSFLIEFLHSSKNVLKYKKCVFFHKIHILIYMLYHKCIFNFDFLNGVYF